VIAALAAIVGVTLYLWLLHSADRARTQLQSSVAKMRTTVALFEQHAAEHERLRTAPTPAASGADLRTVIQTRADAARLPLTRIDARDPDQVQVTLGAVAFADWLALTALLQAQQVRLETARIEALAAPGLVSVSATFARSRAP
jgi:type II secretory pathway component PulM